MSHQHHHDHAHRHRRHHPHDVTENSFLKVVSESTALPIPLKDVREQNYVSPSTGPTADDNLLTRLTKAAVRFIERDAFGGIQIAKTTYDWLIEDFPHETTGVIRLPRPPLDSVTSVKYFDSDGVEQTFSSTGFLVHKPSESPAEIELVPDGEWPETEERRFAVTVRFVAGYESTGTGAIPPNLEHAIHLVASDFYSNRGDDRARVSDHTERRVRDLVKSSQWGYVG